MERRQFLSMLGGSAPAAGLARVAPGAASRGPRAGYIPNFALTTHEGKQVRFYDDLVHGKLVLINFMYTNCGGLCPGQTANLIKVQRHLGDRVGQDVFMYSLTLEAETDTPQVLRQYAEGYDTRPGWLYLTGKRAEIEIIRRRLGFVDLDPAKDIQRSTHIGVVLYGYEPLDRWAACPALGEPDLIASNVLSLIGERPPWRSTFRKSSPATP
jgi:protein SCO1/2